MITTAGKIRGMGASGSLPESTLLGLQYDELVEFRNVSDWSVADSFVLPNSGFEDDLKISPDNTFFMRTTDSASAIYSMTNGAVLWANGNRCKGDISRDSQYIAVRDSRNEASIIETTNWTVTAALDYDLDNRAPILAFSNDGTKVAMTLPRGRELLIFNTSDGSVYSAFESLGDTPALSLVFSSDDTMLLIGTELEVSLTTVQPSLNYGDVYQRVEGNECRAIFGTTQNILYVDVSGSYLKKIDYTTNIVLHQTGESHDIPSLSASGKLIAYPYSSMDESVLNASDLTIASPPMANVSSVKAVCFNKPIM